MQNLWQHGREEKMRCKAVHWQYLKSLFTLILTHK